MNSNNIEKILKSAPQPRPPADLREQVIAAGLAAAGNTRSPRGTSPSGADGFRAGALRDWARRWWSALIPAGATVLCLGIVVAQQAQIRELEREVAALPQAAPAPSALVSQPETPQPSAPAEPDALAPEPEIDRLRSTVARLGTEIATLEQARQTAQQAGATVAPGQDFLTPEELAPLVAAKDKAMRINCANNLKQFGLAVRIWANDHQGAFPAAIADMRNELSTPKVLVCPADTSRRAAENWNVFTSANVTYEYLGASASENDDPQRVLSRCAIHNNIGLFDGSVQMTKPDSLVSRDGKLYMITPARGYVMPATNAPNGPSEEARKRFMQRYGLKELPQPAPQSP